VQVVLPPQFLQGEGQKMAISGIHVLAPKTPRSYALEMFPRIILVICAKKNSVSSDPPPPNGGAPCQGTIGTMVNPALLATLC